MDDYSYLPQQSEEHFVAHNRNDLNFIELNPLSSCLICFPIEEQSSRQFQNFWNWFLNEHLAKTYTIYTTYYFDQAYFEDDFAERKNSINQLLYSTTFEQQPSDFEYLNYQIHIWIAAHQSTVTPLETKEKSYQTAPIFDLFLSKLEHFTQTVTPEPMAQNPMQLDDFERTAAANQYDDEYKFQIVGGYLQGSSAIWFSQKTDANAHQRIIRTPILISKWCIELEKRTQGPGKIVTEYAKAIRKLIKCVDSGRNWTEEQKIHSFTKGLRTNLSYALWPLLALKNNPTINMAIELAQRIEDNQRIHLESTLPVFASALVMAPAPQMAAPQQPPYQRQQNHGPPVCYRYTPPKSESASQPEENSFYIFNLTDNDHDMDKLAINTTESTRKKKKAKVDFVLDPNKPFTLTADNNEPPKAKVFKNPPKLEPPEIVQKSGPYSVVKDLMETPAHITFDQLMTHPQFRKDLCKSLISKKKIPKTNKCSRQAGLADNSNVTPLICKAQVAGYFINLILDSGLSKGLGIAKAIPVRINGISIETDMEVSKAKEYTIIVGNEWLKKAKALFDYELCELTIKYGEKLIVVKCRHWTTPPANKQDQKEEQSDESDDKESDEKEKQEEQEETTELTYTIFTSNGKPLNNVKADKKEIIVNGKLICWPYYDILRRTFDQKPGKKAKYRYWWHGPCVWCWCNQPLYSPSNECKLCLIYYKDWELISLIPREKLKEVQKFFENKPFEIQLLVVKQRELSPEERKIDIENLLTRNSPVISKESDTPGQTHVIQHIITTKKTRPIHLKSYQSNCHNDEFIKKEIKQMKDLGLYKKPKVNEFFQL
ncbi:hypothetical protein G9A89_005543 [Geosiphon pyriformis]|nr:hypothetical protein G9A89_005543 [Geosiphon pyriformis]